MKLNELKRNWPSVCVDVTQKSGKFTDEDLFMSSGQRESFVRLFEMRYGDGEEAAGVKIDAIIEGLEARPERKSVTSWPQRCWTNPGSCIHIRK